MKTLNPIVFACVMGVLLAAMPAMSGCSSTLETGYKPRPLGSSDEVRRGFYAQQYTPEAQKAKDYESEYNAAAPGSSAAPRVGQ